MGYEMMASAIGIGQGLGGLVGAVYTGVLLGLVWICAVRLVLYAGQ